MGLHILTVNDAWESCSTMIYTDIRQLTCTRYTSPRLECGDCIESADIIPSFSRNDELDLEDKSGGKPEHGRRDSSRYEIMCLMAQGCPQGCSIPLL